MEFINLKKKAENRKKFNSAWVRNIISIDFPFN